MSLSFFKKMTKGFVKAGEQLARLQRAIDSALKVINESEGIYRSSTKHLTRISRLDVAINRLALIIEEYPLWPDHAVWVNRHANLVAEREKFFMPNLESFVAEAIANIDEGKTAKTRANRAQKLIETLEAMEDDQDCDGEWVEAKVSELGRLYLAPPEK